MKSNAHDHKDLVSFYSHRPKENIFLLKQEHSDKIHFISSKDLLHNHKQENYAVGDAFMAQTQAKKAVLAMKTADCLAVFLCIGKIQSYQTKKKHRSSQISYCYDFKLQGSKHKSMIALIHAGWRGLEKEIITKSLSMMLEKAYQEKLPLGGFFLIGPSACGSCYEVGSEFLEKFHSYPKAFLASNKQQSKFLFDMHYIAKKQLETALLNFYDKCQEKIKDIENTKASFLNKFLDINSNIANHCTIENNSHFFHIGKEIKVEI